MLPTSALDYHLPEHLIATAPASPRDSARLMVLHRSEPDAVDHRLVRDLPDLLESGDRLVVNTTRVLPARFHCTRADSGGKGEGLFIAEQSAVSPAPTSSNGGDSGRSRLVWQVLLKLRRAKPGCEINLLTHDGRRSGVWLRLIERASMGSPEHAGADGWITDVCHDRSWSDSTTTLGVLERVGLPPLPPYILASRRRHDQPIEASGDAAEYQTVFASPDASESHGRGSVAAPTAGLHLTPELLSTLECRGISRSGAVLHVGMGTFKPVETEFVEQHPMHSERCAVPRETVEAIAESRDRRAGRIVAVGTTSTRTLESFSSLDDMLRIKERDTRILITPGYRFRHTDALLTNFHLPRSTLLAMVAAFLDDDDRVRGRGLARLLDAYSAAVREGYRFYSFGDAMLILP
ncbi:MAG: tRNA preQ1(34) S-adenosylmethionine ribosyltransferase-isomerase QueA [Phycisphaerales bacterium]|nr:tRNA preQ1(34) S-adenosylmethionine ribosyltransferase-isomerase QueA [Phycisphaerales bacterium]